MRSHAALAELARAQYGVVSFRQLRELGFSKGHISRAQGAGRLWRIHQGVYAVGHAGLSAHGRAMAAVLVFPEGAVLSHDSAAWLWGLVPNGPHEVEVTVAARGNRRRGLRVHRAWSLPEEERARYESIPVTSVARTLLDVAGTRSGRRLVRVVDRARRRGKLDLDEIDRVLARGRASYGTERLQDALRLYRTPVFDRARSELLFLDAIAAAGLPVPALNTWVEKFEIDAYWEAERFAVEVDGWETHGTRRAFEADRLRQEDMKLAGIDSIRVSARRIEREPDTVAKRLQLLLARRRAELGI
ncbi:MAG TPA: type IV toxin-antitoxin system AbiEi family antitoxin domain-containing protein [Solirubrobacterales bacterium]|nr:type IV toxin-antitoxin system AbiEi family antitoxin domain-containing protein [Solirubrobacterales bacterium]